MTTVDTTVLVFAASGGRRIVAPTSMVVFTAIAGGVIRTVAAGVLEYDTVHLLGAPRHVHTQTGGLYVRP